MVNPANAGILRAVGVHFFPMGALYIRAYLERHGYQVDIKDFCVPGERPDYSNVAQFSILTPYPGTALSEELMETIWTRHRSFYDSQHLVYRHNHISFIRMEWLFLKANLLYYTRSKKAIKDV